MKRVFLLLVLACLPAGAVELPVEARVANRGPMCAWACLETAGKLNDVAALEGLRDYRYTARGREPAYDTVIKAELDKRGVNYKLAKSFSYDRSLLEQYGSQHGAMVSFKQGSEWSPYCHAVFVTEYGPDSVKFYCPDKRNKNGQPHVWTATRQWFDANWIGNSVVILPDPEPEDLGPNSSLALRTKKAP